jgi:hypothetical protein
MKKWSLNAARTKIRCSGTRVFSGCMWSKRSLPPSSQVSFHPLVQFSFLLHGHQRGWPCPPGVGESQLRIPGNEDGQRRHGRMSPLGYIWFALMWHMAVGRRELMTAPRLDREPSFLHLWVSCALVVPLVKPTSSRKPPVDTQDASTFRRVKRKGVADVAGVVLVGSPSAQKKHQS